MDRSTLAALILGELDTVVARTREAYVTRVPGLRDAPPETMDAALEATRRTMRLFCRYYVEGTLDAEAWRGVRDVTLDRAGETFSAAEIGEIVAIAKEVGAETVERLAADHPDITAAERAQVLKAMDRYVTELAQQEDRPPLASPSRLDDVLGALEAEGADLQ
jgi:post-segregation antitoxin (ccd killing protein)